MDEIETTESLNILFTYIMKPDDEWNFYCDMAKLSDKEPRPRDKQDKTTWILYWSINDITAMLLKKKHDSLPYQLADRTADRAKALLEPDNQELIQKIFDIRKSYLMKYSRLERQFLERV